MESVSHSDIVPSRPVTFTAPVSHQSSPHKFSKADNFDPRKHGDSLPGPANLDRKLRQFASMGYTVLVRPEEFENHVLPDETRSLLRDPDPSVVKQIRRECLFRRREKPKPTENDVGEFFVGLIDRHSLCPKHKATLSRFKPAKNDRTKAKVDAALYVKEEAPKDSRPDWVRCRLFIEFKRGGTSLDPYDDTKLDGPESKAQSRVQVQAQLTAYAHNVFLYQHRAWLYSLFVNGEEFRVMRWDRSGVIATKKMNYFEDAKFLIRFLSYFDALTAVGQGTDPTATLIGKDSRLYELMDRYAEDSDSDMDHADGTVVPKPPTGVSSRASSPASQSTPSHPHAPRSKARDAAKAPDDRPAPPFPPSEPPPRGDIDPEEPTVPIEGEDPRVFRYVRRKFAQSIKGDWPRYILLVGDDERVFLVGKPVFSSTTMFGRATRGYIALDVKSRRFMFLKDSWRPFYVGVEREGVYLEKLLGIEDEDAKRDIHVPRPFRHGDVGEQRGFTAAYAEWLAAQAEKAVAPLAADGRSSNESDAIEDPLPRGFAAEEERSTLQSEAPSMPEAVDERPASPLPPRSLLGKRSRDDFDTAADTASDNEEQPVSQLHQDSTTEPEQPSYRLYTHYRIAVLDVCLPFSEFTSSKQLVQLMMHCIATHCHAYEQLGLLHRDVSAGNVLILPCLTERKGGGMKVAWRGVLTDWELAKVVDSNSLSEQTARQPERTGTWQFMSAAYIKYHPRRPVEVADELESFFHVMLFYAVRYLRSTIRDVGMFIYDYFDAHATRNGVRGCGHLKSSVMRGGALVDSELIRFLAADNKPNGHLNTVFAALLKLFKSRYDLITWKEEQAGTAATAAPDSGTPITAHVGDGDGTTPAVEDLDEEEGGIPGAAASRRQPVSEPEPTEEETVIADAEAGVKKLSTHSTILGLLANAWLMDRVPELKNMPRGPWPTADTVPDRCPSSHDPRERMLVHMEASLLSTVDDAPQRKKIKTEVSEPSELRAFPSRAKTTQHATEPGFERHGGTSRGRGRETAYPGQ
ncbi:hypothetical protein C8Q77DRAFT_1238364 [Trametes polyzona]|nr:hypothetical protein C8Q77DRAFT_1238364 [Trametes polyzona]